MRRHYSLSVLFFVTVVLCPPTALPQGGWTDNGAAVQLTTSTDKVGIGNFYPDRSLTIGNLTGSNYMNIKDGTRELLFGVDATNAGIISTMTSHDLVFRTGNIEKMRITAGGNIGIGTTVPSAKLHIVPGVSSTAYGLKVDQGPSGHGMLCYVNTTSGNQTVLSATSNASGLYVKGDGKVGIGLSTPAYPLHVSSNSTDWAMAVSQGINGNGISSYVNTTSSTKTVLSASSNTPGLYVLGNGQTLIGLTTASPDYYPSPTLTVLNTAPMWPIGIRSVARNTGVGGSGGAVGGIAYGTDSGDFATGVWGVAWDATYNFGVSGYAEGFEVAANYGVYGCAEGTANYAGYFDGDVFADAYYSPSDAKLKRNIDPLKGALEKVISLNPKSYEYSTETYPAMALPTGTRYGFVAQEFAQVFPQFTKKAVQPLEKPEDIRAGKRSGETLEFTAVDYVSLIPVLTAAIQEQQVMIGQLVAALEANGIEVDILLPGKGKATPKEQGKDLGSETIQAPRAMDLGALPTTYDLSQNYPNPSNPSTVIEYALPNEGNVTIEIYNSIGQKVRTLVNEFQNAGYKSVMWNGKNDAGESVASGSYIYSLTAGDFVKTQKMILAK